MTTGAVGAVGAGVICVRAVGCGSCDIVMLTGWASAAGICDCCCFKKIKINSLYKFEEIAI